jgi:dienelactone hydrolase
MYRSLLLRFSVLALLGAGLAAAAFADGAADNLPEKVRPVPPPGVAVPEADRAALEQGLSELGAEIARLRNDPKATPFLPDVQIYHKAVEYALHNGEFFSPGEINKAKEMLVQGKERARLLSMGQSPWTDKPGPSARGYVSRIDGSVQPYGLYVPETFTHGSTQRRRLDTWFHGRGENLSELNFIDGVQHGGGPFVRPDMFVVQPYGRYCNANKLAGEVDLFEALDDIKRRYAIDENRIIVRGFSMGGAACWTFAAHYASDWAAAAPGAGFSETPDFLKVFQNETLKPTWWEQKLWQMYDCPEYTPNFFNVPTVAYSGEIDSQKQAADVMERAFAAEGMKLTHIIGPKTGHAYHPESVPIINKLVDEYAAKGRDPLPKHVKLATPTLKYNRQAWVTVDALGRHWEPARVDAEILDGRNVALKTKNVTAVSLLMPSSLCPLDTGHAPTVTLDGQKLAGTKVASDHSWTVHFRKEGERWARVKSEDAGGLRKRHDLQGPIDDAFMESFMIVRPTGTPAAPGVSKWVDSELQHALTEWRRQFRGDARVKNDTDVTDSDIAAHNLALWGDPGSNKVLARIADRLPIRWTGESVAVGKERYPASTHAPILIYPNPLNPRKYVVINSGFTYREYDYLNNARQVPKLPDWAVVDTTTPPNSRYPGRIVNAGFFGERWELADEPEHK